jgi:hypothetical protein
MSKGFQVPTGKFYLVDGEYANTPFFLVPYRGVRYHLKEFGLDIKDHRTQRMSSTTTMHYSGIMWKGLWGCLRSDSSFSKLPYSTCWKIKIPVSAPIFHNLIRLLHGDEEWLGHHPDISPTNFVALPNGNQINDLGTVQGNALRDTITQ